MSIKKMICLLAAAAGMGAAGHCQAGDGVEQVLTQQAQAGDIQAQRLLGAYYSSHNPKQAVYWYSRAARAGDGEAMTALGRATRDGALGIPADWNRGMSLLQDAAASGNGNAIYELDTCCAAGDDHLPYAAPQDGVEGLRWAIDTAGDTADDDSAQSEDIRQQIAGLSRAGHGAGITAWRLAFLHDQDAAGKGDGEALQAIAEDYLSGHGVAPDAAQAEQAFQRLADDGTIAHQMLIAEHYEAGDFGATRNGLATIYYRRAADLLSGKAMSGDADAQVQLAGLYADHKLGADGSDANAVTWYSRAAATGNLAAEAGLGKLMLAGKGAAPDPDKGLSWLTLAANNNNQRLSANDAATDAADAQRDLAHLYADGYLVPKNDYLAWVWLSVYRSHIDGDDTDEMEEAAALQKAAQGHLDAGQLAQAQAAVTAWHQRFDPAPEMVARLQK